MNISRRDFVKGSLFTAGSIAAGLAPSIADAASEIPRVYFTKDLSAAGMLRLYAMVNHNITGKIAVKLHTGEPDGPNILPREWIKVFLAQMPHAHIVECNVLYPSPRRTTEGHRKTLEQNGWTSFTTVDIMDEDGDAPLPVSGGKWLKEVAVGSHLLNYDSMVVLTHFKGHAMGGFGGALKNISVGIASSNGKAWIHTAGKVKDPAQLWSNLPEQDAFLESMAEASKAIVDHAGERIIYINVANKLSVDCDCDGNPAAPKMADLGIFASLDPVALDRACVDMVMNSEDPGKGDLIERINSRHGTHILEHAEKLGVGSQKYVIVEL